MTIRCNVCGKENNDNAQVCVRCGVALVKSGIPLTETIEMRLNGEERTVFQLEPPVSEGYIVGRSDEGSDYMPDIDLSQYEGRERGVSRRHAAFIRYRGTVHVLDLNSVNGTYLNGRRLLPDTPYPLNYGDDLKLGQVRLTIMPGKT